jgi:predicted negative regulator of RcsB-dependent stress response
MDKRLKDIQQGTLTESRLNSDFLFWLKEQGPNWLLGALLVLCGVLGWNWWTQRQEAGRDQAWSELSSADSPQALVEIAERHAGQDAVGVLATLQAADRYMEAIRSGKRPDREPTAEDAAVTPELRAQYLDEADRLYQRAAAGVDPRSPSQTLLLASALFGRAAVAESRGDAAAAETQLKAVQAATQDTYPPLAKIADDRMATLQSILKRSSLPAKPAAPAIPTTTGAIAPIGGSGDATALDLNLLGSGAPAAAPASPAAAPAPQPK